MRLSSLKIFIWFQISFNYYNLKFIDVILSMIGITTKIIVHHSCQKWLFYLCSFWLILISYRKASILTRMMKYKNNVTI